MFHLFTRQVLQNNLKLVSAIQEASPNFKSFKTSTNVRTFYEPDEKAGYRKDRKLPSKAKLVREGLKELKNEIALWTEEMKERLRVDPLFPPGPGETDIAWSFENEECVKNWIVTSDSDNNEGFSNCSLTLNKYKKGVFAGEICTKVPKDGIIKRTGYCNITTLRARKSFKRDAYHDWTAYNMLVLKIRGDGRSYLLTINTKGYYDITWFDSYNYVLYTRGGPYWQVTKIPFSKFFLSSKGRIQDRQGPLPLDRITSFGISAGKVDGEFQLEIDYIGLELDPNHIEDFAYEMYQQPRYIVAT